MKVKFFTKSISVLAAVLVLASCEKDFLDVNTNPNGTLDATPEVLLPSALGYASYNIGNQYQIVGGFFSQYWTQGPSASQYLDYEQYRVTVSEFNRPWSDMYRGPITDLRTLARKGIDISVDPVQDATAQARGRNYAAISYVMQAYLFQLITDLYGDVPFVDAGKGVEGILSPRYDPQPLIYDSLITYVDKGLGLMDFGDGHPGNDDLFYAGDMEGWYRFANTLKLKIYMRQSGVRPDVASAGIAALFADPEVLFIEEGYTAQVLFNNGTQFNRNPLFQSINFLGGGNIIASNTLLNYFAGTGDPRVEQVFVPATTGNLAGQFSGLEQGVGIVDPRPSNDASDFALPSELVGGRPNANDLTGANAPVIFMSDYESYFLQAEAFARGYASGDAQSTYESGIAASFAKYGLTPDSGFLTQTSVAYPTGGSVEDQVKAIITQKWAAMAAVQNIEAWTEYRRTNYPDFLIVSRGATSANGQKPNRLPYASDEQSRNGNFPGLKDIFERVWWDVN